MQAWLPYLPVIIIPGVLNLITASYELNKKCRALVFFQPFKSLGVYFWGAFQFIAPILITIWLLKIPNTAPPLTLELYLDSLLIGVSFVGILNSTPELINIKPIYSFFVGIAYNLIAKRQTQKTAFFWRQVEVKLEANKNFLDHGLDYLDDYFIVDISLNDQETQHYQQKLVEIRAVQDISEKIKQIKSLLKDVRRNDLAVALQQFGFEMPKIQSSTLRKIA